MNPEIESTPINQPDNSPGNTASSFGSFGSFGGLRSRYYAFLEKHKEPASLNYRARLSQGTLNIMIFSALIVAILMVFGIGFSWFNGSAQKGADIQINQSVDLSAGKSAAAENPTAEASAAKSPAAESPANLTPALIQPAGPAGHAEVRSQSAPVKKSEGK